MNTKKYDPTIAWYRVKKWCACGRAGKAFSYLIVDKNMPEQEAATRICSILVEQEKERERERVIG